MTPTHPSHEHVAATTRLALWATADIDHGGPADRPWRIVSHAGHPISANATSPPPRLDVDRLVAFSARNYGLLPPAADRPLCFPTLDDAQRTLADERRKAAFAAIHGLHLPNTTHSYQELYSSLGAPPPDDPPPPPGPHGRGGEPR